MIIYNDPDRYKTVTTSYTCWFHKENPGVPFAGCCCSATISSVEVTPEEYQERKQERLRKRREELLKELKNIDLVIGIQ